MPSTITFIKNVTRDFVSAYRPIDIWAYLNDNDVAYLRAELFMEQNYGNNNFVSTGVQLNGYEQNEEAGGFPGVYSFNAMEYVRHYIGKANCVPFSFPTFQLPGQFETGRFFLRIWAVRYVSTEGVTWDDVDTTVDSNIFIATPASLSNISTDWMGDNLWLDRYVLGNNGLAPTVGSVLPLTTMPNSYSYNQNNGFMIDMEDFPCDSLYTYWNKTPNNLLLHMLIYRYNDGVNFSGVDMVQLNDQYSRKERVPVHPIALSSYISFATGTPYYSIVNSSGNLICKKVQICLVSGNNPTGFLPTAYWNVTDYDTGIANALYQTINYSNTGAESQGKCQRTKFVFQNSLGAFDWFSCYGTIEESVSVSEQLYQKNSYVNVREKHTTTKLITNRTDIVKVTSQPLGKETAKFLAELYASPKVWVQHKLKYAENSSPHGQYRLTPINLVPGKWDLYSTEENLYFLEFEYSYSEKLTQPIG